MMRAWCAHVVGHVSNVPLGCGHVGNVPHLEVVVERSAPKVLPIPGARCARPRPPGGGIGQCDGAAANHAFPAGWAVRAVQCGDGLAETLSSRVGLSVKKKVLPRPTSDSSHTRPPCDWTIRRTMVSPAPVPS